MNKEEFINELKKINIELTKQQLTLLEEYYIILKEENEKYNLTRIIEQNEVYLKHFYDSLTINKIIDIYSQNICDLGSGAGFPGLVLAICFPKTKITLIESNGKKCYSLIFVQSCIICMFFPLLNLENNIFYHLILLMLFSKFSKGKTKIK